MSTITVTPLTDPDIPGAVACIQRAFAADPYNNWVFHQPAFDPARNAYSLTLRCRWGMKHALFHVAKDGSDPTGAVLGVACWLPPAEKESWSDYLGAWALWLEQVRMNALFGRGGLNVRRYWIWKAAQAAAQRELWTDPRGYYFCNIVTVAPEAQGKGVGRALFARVTDVADAEGRRCYLESSRAEPNMQIYRRLGFELRREMVCDDEGEAITLYCMMREPRTTETTAAAT